MYTINADGSRNFLQIADVKGRWQKIKNVVFAVLIAIYIVIPWIPINGNPAMLIDIPGRHAYLFGGTFTNKRGSSPTLIVTVTVFPSPITLP